MKLEMKSESDEAFKLTAAFAAEWKDLGKKLGVTRDDLDTIEKTTEDIEMDKKNSERLELVWGKWLNAPNPKYPPTWIGLCKLLRDTGKGDHSKYLNL
jgi:hypothetical protein